MKPIKVNYIRNIVYGQGIDRRKSSHAKSTLVDLFAGLYTPDMPSEHPRPCIIFLHGGSWERGSKGQQGWLGNPAARKGYVTFCPTYRYSYQDIFPGPLEDAKCAVRFMRAHADEYGIDPNRIVIGGGSSGGHLAMMTALTPGRWEGRGGYHDQNSAVQATIAFAGPSFLPAMAKKGFVQRHVGGPIWSIGIDRYLEASPYSHVHRGMPPLLMFHAKKDVSVPYQQSKDMLNLCRQGFKLNNVKLITAKGGHNFMFHEERRIEALGQMFDWLHEVLYPEECEDE